MTAYLPSLYKACSQSPLWWVEEGGREGKKKKEWANESINFSGIETHVYTLALRRWKQEHRKFNVIIGYLKGLKIGGSQVIQGFPWCTEKEQSSLSKARSVLGRASNGLGPGPWGSCDFTSVNPTLLPKGLSVVLSLWHIWDISVPLFNTAWLASCWPCPFAWQLSPDPVPFPLKTVYKMLYFLINLLARPISLCKPSWS